MSAACLIIAATRPGKNGESGNEIDVNSNMLICDACSTDASVRLRCSAGLFNYNFAFGIDFVESNQPVGFINFIKFIARHIAAEMHRANLVCIILRTIK